MYKIHLICVGKLRDRWLQEGVNEYRKRLSRFVDLTLTEVAESSDLLPPARLLSEEGQRLSAKLRPGAYVIAVDLNGWLPADSVTFARQLDQALERSGGQLSFLIAGSNGYAPKLLAQTKERWSLSPLTMPHLLTRLVFLEQLYRSFKILSGETYHK
ncbi:MAG: 23S rRNA (pseudouridine(1915)-N(3))-methyltransferase RlmH [Oscillospiraceae bacterium]|nr:23S rRNA (pseudouridine(1915)-N(3))-methyltransferase RlmH [Oscillospiraceae bacterium]MDD4367663.1 23S rRNA (pseudouridine(1915)-N(3))-methyltransferase RlmH [Oscillospiraceae bacterium]